MPRLIPSFPCYNFAKCTRFSPRAKNFAMKYIGTEIPREYAASYIKEAFCREGNWCMGNDSSIDYPASGILKSNGKQSGKLPVAVKGVKLLLPEPTIKSTGKAGCT